MSEHVRVYDHGLTDMLALHDMYMIRKQTYILCTHCRHDRDSHWLSMGIFSRFTKVVDNSEWVVDIISKMCASYPCYSMTRIFYYFLLFQYTYFS